MTKYPNLKISVVTVCYNAVEAIEETILSVLNQTYNNVEYIIIDGGSTDGTVDIIKKYSNKLYYWISEPDNGIYDAMNKGIKVATGDYINFMNAGDCFFDNDVIKSIFEFMNIAPNVIYGSTFMKYSYGNYIVIPDDINKLTRCMTHCHQSTFVRRATMVKHPFRQSYGLSADHGSLLEIYEEAPDCFYKVNRIIAEYDATNGVTARNALKAYKSESNLTKSKDSVFRKLRILVRAYFPLFIMRPLGQLYFLFNRRYKRVK